MLPGFPLLSRGNWQGSGRHPSSKPNHPFLIIRPHSSELGSLSAISHSLIHHAPDPCGVLTIEAPLKVSFLLSSACKAVAATARPPPSGKGVKELGNGNGGLGLSFPPSPRSRRAPQGLLPGPLLQTNGTVSPKMIARGPGLQ